MSKGGKYARKKEKKPLGKKKIILITVCSLAAVLLMAVICAVVFFDGFIGQLNTVEVPKVEYSKPTEETIQSMESTGETTQVSTETETEPHVASSADYINFLVVGQAARAGEAERFADTMILCTVNTYEKTLTMTSLLRDSFVKMPDYKGRTGGRIKLTTIYHLGSTYGDGIAGSMELMNMALYNNFGIEVDYNFEIDFDAFIKIVDMLGGVELELTEAEANYLNNDKTWVNYHVEPGFASIDGMTALSYARMRKAAGDGDSDINRTSRQRNMISAILNKLRTRSVSELTEIANEVLPLISTSMTKSEITQMLLKLLPMLPELTIEAGGTCPANYKGDSVDIYNDGMLHSVLRFDVAETTKTMRAITEGETE